jgi:hypothetical protein
MEDEDNLERDEEMKEFIKELKRNHASKKFTQRKKLEEDGPYSFNKMNYWLAQWIVLFSLYCAVAWNAYTVQQEFLR